MNSCSPNHPEARDAFWWWGGAFLVVLLALAIRSESFWIDELSSAYVAAAPDWASAISRLGELGSEAQMPLHMAWLWIWGRATGTGEWALRASNLPWAILAAAAWVGLLRYRAVGKGAVWLLLSPFVCYYMNEARPYAMTFASGMLALYAIERLCDRSPGNGAGFATAALMAGVGLCLGASMLNVILVPSLLAYATVRVAARGGRASAAHLVRSHAATIGSLLLILGALAGYYIFTLVQGHGGQREAFSFVNVAYTVYELMGFGGLGAPRILFREMTTGGVLSRYGATLATGAVVWGLAACVLWRFRREWLRDAAVRAAAAGLAVGMLCLVGVAIAFKAALWGRHFMAVLPLFFWGLACAWEVSRRAPSRLATLAGCALVGLFVLSSARQRMLDEYGKEPLREAVTELQALARQEPEQPALALVYPLALWRYGDAAGGVAPVTEWPEARIRRWQENHHAYTILIHRADKSDPAGFWTGDLERREAAVIWQRGNAKIYRLQRIRSGGDG